MPTSHSSSPATSSAPVRLPPRPLPADPSCEAEPDDDAPADHDGLGAERTDRHSAPRSPSRDYEIGFGKPPKATQFKPGQSGNPKGRPKGSRNAQTIIDEVLHERVKVKINGTLRNRSILEIAIHQQGKKAAGGDQKALAFLLSYLAASAAQGDGNASGVSAAVEPELDEGERTLLAHHIARRLQAGGHSPDEIEKFQSLLQLTLNGDPS